jgi:hypothetical protein
MEKRQGRAAMKIQPPDGSIRSEAVQQQRRKADGEFEQLLNNAVEKDEGARAAQASMPASQLTCASLIRGDAEKALLVQETEAFLAQLDDYRHKLGHTEITLKDLAPLIDRLAETRDRLRPRLDNLAEGDALRGILNQVLVTSSVEIARFTRGDYL